MERALKTIWWFIRYYIEIVGYDWRLKQQSNWFERCVQSIGLFMVVKILGSKYKKRFRDSWFETIVSWLRFSVELSF